MGRLIDADALIETMKKTEEEYEDAMTCPSWWTAYSVISEQPTAYDVKKVEKEMEEVLQDLNVVEVLSHVEPYTTIQRPLENFLDSFKLEIMRTAKRGG